MNLFLAIDGGGSRTTCLAIRDDGAILGAGAGGPSNHLLVDHAIVTESLKTSINEALRAAGARMEDVCGLSAGLAGVDHDGTGADEMRAIFAEMGLTDAVIDGDMVIAHAGALADEPGVLALAGTGSSILGVGPDGRRIKVGGWGPVFGDEGSGYRIGQSALRAAARDFDGRGPSTDLTAAVIDELDLVDFKGAIGAVYLDDMKPRDVARLSKTVDRVAAKGDPVAIEILETAGVELAECVAAAIRRLDLSKSHVKVSYQGSVILSCETMRTRFCRELRQEFSGVEIVSPRFPPVIGAYLLGRTERGSTNDDALLSTLENGVAEKCR